MGEMNNGDTYLQMIREYKYLNSLHRILNSIKHLLVDEDAERFKLVLMVPEMVCEIAKSDPKSTLAALTTKFKMVEYHPLRASIRLILAMYNRQKFQEIIAFAHAAHA
jgi:replicative DNA helicase